MMRWTVLILLPLISHVHCHSWIACSDYTEKNGADWDPDKCRGFPRSAAQYANKNNFGLDRGFDYKPSLTSPGCKTTYKSSEYSDDYPKAIYFPGQQVILAHPMKNHGADPGCTGSYIPDNGNAIYRGKVNKDRDQTFGYYKKILVADLGVSPFGQNAAGVNKYPKPGYQNAPNFCKDTDKSMGTYSFNVPKDLRPGEYTFLWRWSFNGPQDVYATCFDVIITSNKRERDDLLAERGADFYVACGGTTSNNSPGSEAGCDDINRPRPPPPEPPRPGRPGRPGRPPTGSRPPGLPLPSRPSPPPPGKAVFKVNQMSGEIMLTDVKNGIKKRYVSVNFDCPVHASFWNALLLIEHKQEVEKYHFAATQYDLVQEQRSHVMSRKIFFSATFETACSISTQPPIAYIVMEE